MSVFSQSRAWLAARLSRKLMLLLSLSLIVFLVLLGYLSFYTARISVKREVDQSNRRLAALAAININAEYETIFNDVRFLQRELQAPGSTLHHQARTMLDLRRSAPLNYRAMYLFDNQGTQLVHLADPLEFLLPVENALDLVGRASIPLSDGVENAFAHAEAGEFYVSYVQMVEPDQIPILYVGMPIEVEDISSTQILVAEVDLRSLWRSIDQIYMGQTGRAFLVSRKGIIIAHPDRSYIGRPLPPALEPVLSGYESQASYTNPDTGRLMLASYSPVGKQSGWGVVVEQEQAEALTPVSRIVFVTLAVVVVAVLFSGITTLLIARTVIQPIHLLAQTTQTIARTGDLNQSVPVNSRDEVGLLASTFNGMIAGLRQTQIERDAAQAQLRRYAEQLEEMVAERTQELQAAQEQLVRREKLAVLGQLAGGVGHELRNPLSVISNAVYYLKTVLPDIDDTQREYLNMIAHEVRRSEKIVHDLLDLARVKASNQEPVALAGLVASVLAHHPPADNIHTRVTVPQNLPRVWVDFQQIQQVLTNLVTNAYQAMPEGGTLTIQAGPAAPAAARAPEGTLALTVTDTGCGISPQNMEKLFEPLFTTKARGIGLGLAISKNLVEANAGSIHVHSVEGEGCTFILVLPLAS